MKIDVAQRKELKDGWPALLTAFMGIMTGVVALPFYIVGPLTNSLEQEFGWDRISVVSAASYLQFGIIFGMPLAAALATRFGGRSVAIVSFVLLVAILASLGLQLSDVSTLHYRYLALGLLCSGTSPVIFTMLIGKWFVKARGIALGVSLAGTGVAAAIAPIVIESVTAVAGWRTALLAIAGISAIGLPFAIFGYRNPESKSPEGPVLKSAQPRDDGELLKWSVILRDPHFLLLSLLIGLAGLFISALVIHFVPMLLEVGYDSSTAARIAALNGVALIAGRLIVGWLLDKYPAVWLGTAVFVIAGAACAAFAIFGGVAAPIVVVCMGLLIGAEIDLLSYLVMRYFPMRDYARIYGNIYGLFMAASVISPWIADYFINLGGYRELFTASAITFLIVAVLFPLLERFRIVHGAEQTAVIR